LYRGLTTLLFFSVPKTGVRFGAKEFFDKNVFTVPSKVSNFFSGACAGAVEALIVVTPQETVKVKIVHDIFMPQPKFRGFFHGLSSIAKAEGFKGVYAGPMPTVAKQASNQAIRFLVYGEIKAWLDKSMPNSPLTFRTAFSGAVAGAASVFGNTPIDVVKTKVQGLDAHKYNGSIDCCR
jgi:solute carrier family 25 citrate transporter 1